ncbi:MAG: type III secretion T3S chaperone [Parachlamydiaceae bacterium]
MAKTVYPLQQVLEIKKRRVEDAEKIVAEKRGLLKQEEDKLKQRERERDKVQKHHQDKLQQMRDEMDSGTTSPKIQQMKVYLKVVQENLKVEEKKVKDQKEQVKIAERNLENAISHLKMKRLEVDKLQTHRKDWEKEMRKEEEITEAKEQDEIGSVVYMMHKRNHF